MINRQEVMHLLENVRKTTPELVDEVFPGIISYGNFQKILVNLVKEGIPVKDMETILETVADVGATVKDITQITESIRIALKRTITRKFCQGGQMRVLTLDAELVKGDSYKPDKRRAGSIYGFESRYDAEPYFPGR